MADPQPVFKFDVKDYGGVYEKYLTIKKKDFGYENMYFDMEAVPVPVVAPKNLVEVGYRAIRVDFNNNQTYGVVTYVNKFGGDYVIKITWDDGKYDHQYLSVLQKEMVICPPNAV